MNTEKDEVIYYLRLLNFIRPTDFPADTYQRLVEYVNTEDRPDRNTTEEYIPINVIEEVPNRIMTVALMRDTKGVSVDENALVYNKKKFKFDNVYTQDEYDNLIMQTVEFTNKRIAANIDTSLVYYGYSGSGKSTLLDRVLEKYPNVRTFKLYEVYLNKLFVYFNGMKVEVKNVDDDKYNFESSHIRDVMEKFSRKKSNGINLNSSRSHMVLEILFDECKLTCFDLCGNEKSINKEQIAESTFINKSLFNLSRFLTLGEKYKEKGDILLNIIRRTKNILMTVILHDNNNNMAFNHLLLLKDFLKTII